MLLKLCAHMCDGFVISHLTRWSYISQNCLSTMSLVKVVREGDSHENQKIQRKQEAFCSSRLSLLMGWSTLLA